MVSEAGRAFIVSRGLTKRHDKDHHNVATFYDFRHEILDTQRDGETL